MQRTEFLKLIGCKNAETEYIPVACLLRNGIACAGYVNQATNEQFSDVCLLVNARMIDLRDPSRRTEHGAIHDFSDFLEEFVVGMMDRTASVAKKQDDRFDSFQDRFGKSIPLTAIAFDEIAVVYPVVQIGNLLQQVKDAPNTDSQQGSSFLDFDRQSVVVKLLRTKIW